MLPTVTRTAEVVLRVIPGGLREASLALGASEWRTTWRVILPTARAGLTTAIILGVARTVGETAPLILTTLGNTSFNANPLHNKQAALPLYVFQLFRQDIAEQRATRAWNGALVLHRPGAHAVRDRPHHRRARTRPHRPVPPLAPRSEGTRMTATEEPLELARRARQPRGRHAGERGPVGTRG